MSIESNSTKSGDPYYLLKIYGKTAKIKSKAYSYSEAYFRQMYKYLTYPLIILSASATMLSGFDAHPFSSWVVMGISLTTLILVGFNQAINPKDKENRANQIKTEFGEISGNVKQFIMENNKTRQEIKIYGQLIHEQLNIWNSLSPPIKDKFIEKAEKLYASRSRNHSIANSVSKKKENVEFENREIIPLTHTRLSSIAIST